MRCCAASHCVRPPQLRHEVRTGQLMSDKLQLVETWRQTKVCRTWFFKQESIMNRIFRLSFALLALGLACSIVGAQESEKKIKRSQLPAAVETTVARESQG